MAGRFMNPPRVSIIVNNYNYARFLSAAIDSALNQTYANCEVIVVDDGSTDNSRDVIDSYGQRIQAIYKANGGQASALNAGFAASSGAIVMFLDADDALMPVAVETLVSAWRTGVARIQFPLDVIDAAGNRLGKQVCGPQTAEAAIGPFGIGSPTSGNAFCRAALDHVMPVPEDDWRLCADAYLNASTPLFGEVKSLRRPLGNYRVHGANNFTSKAPTITRLRCAVTYDLKLHSYLHKLAPEKIGSCDAWLAKFPAHWAALIASLKESPEDHPWPDDLSTLMRKALTATWRHPYWNIRRKLAYSSWVIASGAAPGAARTLKGLEQRCSGKTRRLLFGRSPEFSERR